jgi:DNA-binding LacI/PurR family transcriptional regulator
MNGRPSSKLAVKLREEISSGRAAADSYLPTERELAEANGIAATTARRALKMLEADGLVAAVPRRGYRVLARANDPDRGAPLAYVLSPHPIYGVRESLHRELVSALQRAAAEHGWGLLAVSTEGRAASAVMEQLRAARTFGVIVDSVDRELFEAALDAGMPLVAIDEWRHDIEIDAVVQDGFLGGMLAARCLLERDCRRIAWLGPMGTGHQALERYGGAFSVLGSESVEIPPERRYRLRNAKDPDGVSVAKKLLSGPARPDGVLALWQRCTHFLVRAADELGLTPGRDFEMVGWSTENEYASAYVPQFSGGEPPPAIVWDTAAMADAAVSRLAERRLNPGLRPIKLKVPVGLRQHQEQE